MRGFLFVLVLAVVLTAVAVWRAGRKSRELQRLALELGLHFQTLVLGMPEGGAIRDAKGDHAAARRRERQGTARLLARLPVSSGWEITGSVDGVEVRLHPVRHGMGLRARYRRPLAIGLQIRTQIGLDQTAHAVGMQDIRIGHEDLDRRLVIQSASEPAASALLRHPGVQTSLLQACALDGRLFVDDQGVELRTGHLSEPAQVRPLLDVLTRTARAIDASHDAIPDR